ncbi:CopG family transcriptional regulator [Promicromonospora sp. NPDC052451]|uniref:CopG family transcriptional regulator n=1 Tax=Promicromonospora sp. NPDC052451 TaxID=3364407 RepID=UPI0037CCBF2F
MKTAISVPDRDFHRFERVASRHGMNRSEFYRRAAEHLADQLEGTSELTRLANAALAAAGQPAEDGLFLAESERRMTPDEEW